MTTKVLLNVSPNRGYAADQVDGITLGELLELVQDAALEWGDDTQVVLHSPENRYGANFGVLLSEPLFERAEVTDCWMCADGVEHSDDECADAVDA